MFKRTQRDRDQAALDPVMDAILEDMKQFGPDSTEYPDLLSHLERVVALRASKDKKRVDPNTIWLVAGNLLGILTIVAYEQKHVMTSKGLNFILKSK